MQMHAKVYKVCLNYCAASFIEDNGRVIKGEERVLMRNFLSYCKAADKTAKVLLAEIPSCEQPVQIHSAVIWAYFLSHGHVPEIVRTGMQCFCHTYNVY